MVVDLSQFSMVCAAGYCAISYPAGYPLKRVVEAMRTYRTLCTQYNQRLAVVPLALNLQFCLNLMGQAIDPLVLTGDIMNEGEVMISLQANNPVSFEWLHVLKLSLAVFMNDIPVARDL